LDWTPPQQHEHRRWPALGRSWEPLDKAEKTYLSRQFYLQPLLRNPETYFSKNFYLLIPIEWYTRPLHLALINTSWFKWSVSHFVWPYSCHNNLFCVFILILPSVTTTLRLRVLNIVPNESISTGVVTLQWHYCQKNIRHICR
jgi:hypothetical protein